jgi:hypothetical protein
LVNILENSLPIDSAIGISIPISTVEGGWCYMTRGAAMSPSDGCELGVVVGEGGDDDSVTDTVVREGG